MTTMKRNDGETLRCSFCNKDQGDVRKLIAGPTVFICDECVEVCNDIIADDKKTPTPKAKADVGDGRRDRPRRHAAPGLVAVLHGCRGRLGRPFRRRARAAALPARLERAERRERAHRLAGDLGDQLEVPVVVEQLEARNLRRGGAWRPNNHHQN